MSANIAIRKRRALHNRYQKRQINHRAAVYFFKWFPG
jgi:hypothetical protein